MVTWVILIKLVNDYALVYQQLRQGSENQFVDPDPNGSKLIFFAPLRDGVNEENQFAFIGKQAPNQN
jgi:hypothetical protein